MAFWDGSNWKDANTTVTDGSWHHGVVTVSGTSLIFYLDGKPDGSHTIANLSSISQNLWLGRENTGATYFSGQLDELKIYNYALTTNQIKLDYNNSAAVRF